MNDPYSRLYHKFAREFPAIYADDHLLSWWTRMLIVADASWPMRPPIPRAVPEKVLSRLVSEGLVIQEADAYSVRGLDAERIRRRDAGRTGAVVRWHSDRNADRNANAYAVAMQAPDAVAMPRRDETRRDETSTAREGLPNLDSAVAKIWEQATGRSVLSSGNYVAEYLDDVCRRHPKSEVGAAILRARKGFDHIPDGPSMVSAMRPILDPFVDPKKAAAAERERQQRVASSRAVEATLRRNHETGFHEKARDPRCPLCSEDAA